MHITYSAPNQATATTTTTTATTTTKHANILPSIGHQNSVTKQLNRKQVSILHLIFDCLIVVYVFVFLQLEKGFTPENSRVVFCHIKQRSF